MYNKRRKKEKKIIFIRRETSLWYTHTRRNKVGIKRFPLHDSIRSG
jgi:hypothetical protein